MPIDQRTGPNQCDTCNSGYYLGDDENCHLCTQIDNCAVTETCGNSQDSRCTTCENGFEQIPGGSNGHDVCSQWACNHPCTACIPENQRTAANQCTRCDSGYNLSGTTCDEFGCNTGGGTSCAVCMPIEQRTGANHCQTCNGGHYFNVLTYACIAFQTNAWDTFPGNNN